MWHIPFLSQNQEAPVVLRLIDLLAPRSMAISLGRQERRRPSVSSKTGTISKSKWPLTFHYMLMMSSIVRKCKRYVSIFTKLCMDLCLYRYVCVCVCKCMYMDVYVYVCICMCTCGNHVIGIVEVNIYCRSTCFESKMGVSPSRCIRFELWQKI